MRCELRPQHARTCVFSRNTTTAFSQREKATLDLELAAYERRWEVEKDARFTTLRQNSERRIEELRCGVCVCVFFWEEGSLIVDLVRCSVSVEALTTQISEMAQKQALYLDQIEAQKALIDQLSRVSQQMFDAP